MKALTCVILLATISSAFAADLVDLRHPSTLNSFCIDHNRDDLCPEFPNDQTDFSDKFVYMFINVETQIRFDVFSWQAFTALNWSETGREPARGAAEFDDFHRRATVFNQDIAATACAEFLDDAQVISSHAAQADGNVLIDQNGNFVVYETRMNATAEQYILDEMLNTLAGQEARDDRPISFPQGAVGTNPQPASVLLKTSWQILTERSDPSNYIVKDGLIYVPAKHSANGQEMCLQEKLGLIGMHIVARTQSGNGDEWLWSTFEHNATVPLAGNSRRVNAIFSNDLFPGGCSAPADRPERDYILYDRDCPDCATNQPSPAQWQWAATPPYAAEIPASQIVRCWEVFEGTAELNRIWQEELQGTPLENYQLISTQWRGADKSPMFEHGEVPRFLTNTTMETFLQDQREGTCLGCHASATTATNADANFIFLLENATDD